MKRADIILTLALIAPLFLIFVEHDEGFMLFLIEIGFLAIIGLMYVGIVLTALAVTNFIQKLLWRVKNGKKSGD